MQPELVPASAREAPPAFLGCHSDQLGARRIVANAELDALRGMKDRTVRWVLMHVIEELARHAGHVDIIGEAIDGSAGE